MISNQSNASHLINLLAQLFQMNANGTIGIQCQVSSLKNSAIQEKLTILRSKPHGKHALVKILQNAQDHVLSITELILFQN